MEDKRLFRKTNVAIEAGCIYTNPDKLCDLKEETPSFVRLGDQLQSLQMPEPRRQ